MRVLALVVAPVAGVLSQSLWEPPNFNITQELLSHGVNLSAFTRSYPLTSLTQPGGCSSVCSLLNGVFGDDQVESRQESAYQDFVNAYWSEQQREISPRCVFKPQKATEVAVSILLSRLWHCPFAVKSGGHSTVPGGSNVQDGVTISFEKMNQITLSSDKKIASLQPGHTWVQVYQTLQPYNLTVLGGRAASVGVGGLLLGGGFSYFSSVYGLACDNIASYEVVTAQGRIIKVSPSENPDLNWALRGGGNNFGIVTQYNLETIPRLPQMWGGTRIYLQPQFSALIDAYYNLGMNAQKDGRAHQILSFTRTNNVSLASAELEYADAVSNASMLAEYNSIQGAVQDGTGIRSLAELSLLEDSAASQNGLRQEYCMRSSPSTTCQKGSEVNIFAGTFTTLLDKDLATACVDIFFEELPPILDAADLLPALSLQVITQPELAKMGKNGGNALGLDAKSGPLLFALVSMRWSNKADDVRLNRFAAKVKDRVLAVAATKGKSSSYLYMNYASPWQDPIAGYGAANKAKLKSIAQKYDPSRVFQTLQPGWFKLDGAPFGNLP